MAAVLRRALQESHHIGVTASAGPERSCYLRSASPEQGESREATGSPRACDRATRVGLSPEAAPAPVGLG